MSLIKKLSAGAVAAVMLASFASCSDTTWVYKTNTTTLPAGVYIAMLGNAYMSALSTISSSTSEEIDSVWDQTIDEKDAETYVKDQALEAAKEYLAINDKYAEFGLELSEEDASSMDSAVDSMWSYFASYIDFEESGASKSSFKEYYMISTKESDIFDYYYGKGGIEEVKDKELKKYYYKNYRAANLISISTADDDGNAVSSKKLKKLKKQAKGYKSRLENGESMSTIIKEYNKANSDDNSTSSSTDNTTVYSKTSNSTMFKKLKKLSKGDILYYYDSTNNVIYVGVAEDIKDQEDNFQNDRDNILTNYKSDDFNDLIDDWTTNVEYTTNSSAVKRYSPRNLVVTDLS